MTPREFAIALLQRGGFPVTSPNVLAIIAWAAIEGGHYANAARYNPLNTTQTWPGSYNPGFKAAPVQAYQSWDDGIGATLKTLSYGAYSGIRTLLHSSAPPDDTIRAIGKSAWGWVSDFIPQPAAAYASYGDRPDPVKDGGGAGFLVVLVGGAALVYGFFRKRKR